MPDGLAVTEVDQLLDPCAQAIALAYVQDPRSTDPFSPEPRYFNGRIPAFESPSRALIQESGALRARGLNNVDATAQRHRFAGHMQRSDSDSRPKTVQEIDFEGDH